MHISASILAADFSKLGDEVRAVARGGAKAIHVDVMDGHFVPNLSMGPEVVRSLRPVTDLTIETHLMIEHPEQFARVFLDAGADIVIVHYEVLQGKTTLLDEIRAAGKRAGLAFNPDKPIDAIAPLLPKIDVALCMTVFPGFAGQRFVEGGFERIRELRAAIDKMNPQCLLEVDGGINERTAPGAVQAGADVLAAASALFAAADGPEQATRRLLQLIETAPRGG